MYFSIPGLLAYVRLEQARALVVVERPVAEGWITEHSMGLESILELPELGLSLPLAELYERVRLQS